VLVNEGRLPPPFGDSNPIGLVGGRCFEWIDEGSACLAFVRNFLAHPIAIRKQTKAGNGPRGHSTTEKFLHVKRAATVTCDVIARRVEELI
jgi:hypothetical protein